LRILSLVLDGRIAARAERRVLCCSFLAGILWHVFRMAKWDKGCSASISPWRDGDSCPLELGVAVPRQFRNDDTLKLICARGDETVSFALLEHSLSSGMRPGATTVSSMQGISTMG